MTAIGVDARAAADVPAGRGRFVRELLRALARRTDSHRYFLYTHTRWEEPLDERFVWRPVHGPDGVWHARVGRKASREAEVFFSTNSYLTAWFTTVPTALNVFDLIAWEAPESVQRRAAWIERLTIRRALRQARRVFCNSESTRRDLAARFRFPSPVSVVPLAADDRFAADIAETRLAETKQRHGLERPFVLAAGTLEPRKNLRRLIDAFAQLPPELRSQHRLVLVGPHGWDHDDVLQKANEEGVRVLGRVSDDDLVRLYRACEVFCYPSLYEGFGLPVLEAMRAGAPVITSNVSSLPEVGGDAVEYVDPRATPEITAALTRLLTDGARREELRARGRERAARFSWDESANLFLSQLAELASTRS
jgi:glycosyltransferase involved in cell wall biosynthesis